MSIRIVVLASGNGSNLQTILDRSQQGELAADVAAVFSDVAGAYALQRAANEGVPAICVDPQEYSDAAHYDAALCRQIRNFEPDLIVLAGYMRILSKRFVNHWPNRIMNIHPSLLPSYKGLNTHQRVLDAGDSIHGATVHFVTPQLDAGPTIIQAEIEVHSGDTARDLQNRVHRIEYVIYPIAIQWFAENRISVVGSKVLLDGRVSDQQYLRADMA